MYFVFGFDVFLFIWVVYDKGRHYVYVFFLLFLVSHMVHWLLIYIMRLFMVYVFYFMFCEIKKLIWFTCIFHTCVYVFVECFRNLQVNSVMAIVYFSN